LFLQLEDIQKAYSEHSQGTVNLSLLAAGHGCHDLIGHKLEHPEKLVIRVERQDADWQRGLEIDDRVVLHVLAEVLDQQGAARLEGAAQAGALHGQVLECVPLLGQLYSHPLLEKQHSQLAEPEVLAQVQLGHVYQLHLRAAGQHF
jgi:hypothetical protein